jgi:hypothetical protein
MRFLLFQWALMAAIALASDAFPWDLFELPDGAIRAAPGEYSVADRLAQFGPDARRRWAPCFRRAGVSYPPREVTLVGIKSDRRLIVYANDGTGRRRIREFPILGASGGPGPKKRFGDRQVPEGLYRVEWLNPNSSYHLSMRVSYPNDFDRRVAAADGRTNLGGDIMIHGGTASVGCLAMGDEAAEDLFVLAADTSPGEVHVIVTPVDFRRQLPPALNRPAWAEALYREIARTLRTLPD